MSEQTSNTQTEQVTVLNSDPTTTTPAAQPAALTTAQPVTLTALQVEFTMAEQLLSLKYQHLQIIPGSLTQDATHPVYGNKRRVRVKCPHCPTVVERATSDLHTFKACPTCLKGVRKTAKAQKKLAELQALANAQSN